MTTLQIKQRSERPHGNCDLRQSTEFLMADGDWHDNGRLSNNFMMAIRGPAVLTGWMLPVTR